MIIPAVRDNGFTEPVAPPAEATPAEPVGAPRSSALAGLDSMMRSTDILNYRWPMAGDDDATPIYDKLVQTSPDPTGTPIDQPEAPSSATTGDDDE